LLLPEKRSIFVFVTISGKKIPKYLRMIKKEHPSIERDGLPPFVKSWPQLYTILIVTLALLIGFFYLFMTHFQ